MCAIEGIGNNTVLKGLTIVPDSAVRPEVGSCMLGRDLHLGTWRIVSIRNQCPGRGEHILSSHNLIVVCWYRNVQGQLRTRNEAEKLTPSNSNRADNVPLRGAFPAARVLRAEMYTS